MAGGGRAAEGHRGLPPLPLDLRDGGAPVGRHWRGSLRKSGSGIGLCVIEKKNFDIFTIDKSRFT